MTRDQLIKLYIEDNHSISEIARLLKCSVHKVTYWMDKYNIKRRSISNALYSKYHPDGDPFTIRPIRTHEEAWLQGMGLGLYWGEGTKANPHSVRLGNSDPKLISMFIKFLTELYGVKKDALRFGLQIFNDTTPTEALHYWLQQLAVPATQFYAVTVTKSSGKGTYRKKNRYGVVTVYYHNKKLRDILVGTLPR